MQNFFLDEKKDSKLSEILGKRVIYDMSLVEV
jgi:hypothetical protein